MNEVEQSIRAFVKIATISVFMNGLSLRESEGGERMREGEGRRDSKRDSWGREVREKERGKERGGGGEVGRVVKE